MKFSQKNFENWRFWKMHFFWVGHFEFFFLKKKIFFCFFPMKISHSLLVSKDGSKFWSSQTWQHFLNHTKHSWGECIISAHFFRIRWFCDWNNDYSDKAEVQNIWECIICPHLVGILGGQLICQKMGSAGPELHLFSKELNLTCTVSTKSFIL